MKLSIKTTKNNGSNLAAKYICETFLTYFSYFIVHPTTYRYIIVWVVRKYFSSRWAREAKPYTDKQGNTRSAHRMVADQPLILSTGVEERMNLEDEEAGPRYNLRKLSELPYHLIKSEMWNEFVEV